MSQKKEVGDAFPLNRTKDIYLVNVLGLSPWGQHLSGFACLGLNPIPLFHPHFCSGLLLPCWTMVQPPPWTPAPVSLLQSTPHPVSRRILESTMSLPCSHTLHGSPLLSEGVQGPLYSNSYPLTWSTNPLQSHGMTSFSCNKTPTSTIHGLR